MEAKRLIPYSVHLREDIYLKLKAAAKERKATSLVRDAITMIIEGDDSFNGGYNKALRDAIAVIHDDMWCKSIGIHGRPIALYIEDKLGHMIINQNIPANKKKKKESTNG